MTTRAYASQRQHTILPSRENNSFQTSTASDLAITYNDISVLENYHAASLFRLMQTPGANILSAFEPVVAPKIKRRIIRLILNTDMAFHFDLLQSFNEGMKGDGRMLKDLVLSTLLHAADVSNPTKRFDIAKKWAMRIEEEMFLQGDKEAALGLSVSPYRTDQSRTQQ